MNYVSIESEAPPRRKRRNGSVIVTTAHLFMIATVIQTFMWDGKTLCGSTGSPTQMTLTVRRDGYAQLVLGTRCLSKPFKLQDLKTRTPPDKALMHLKSVNLNRGKSSGNENISGDERLVGEVLHGYCLLDFTEFQRYRLLDHQCGRDAPATGYNVHTTETVTADSPVTSRNILLYPAPFYSVHKLWNGKMR